MTYWSAHSSPKRSLSYQVTKVSAGSVKPKCEFKVGKLNLGKQKSSVKTNLPATLSHKTDHLKTSEATSKQNSFETALSLKTEESPLSQKSNGLSTIHFNDILSGDTSTLDLDIEKYFSFLSSKTKSNATTPIHDLPETLDSVKMAVSKIESTVNEGSSENCENVNCEQKSPKRRSGTIKRRRRRRIRRSGVPCYVPDYIKPAYGRKEKRTSAFYQLNLSDTGKRLPDQELLDSMAAFINAPSVQECRQNSHMEKSKV